MLIRLLQIFFFLTAATIEVRVHASNTHTSSNEPDNSTVFQEPAECIEEGGICAIKNKSNSKYDFEVGPAKLAVGTHSTLIRTSSTNVNLITGNLLVNASDTFFVETEFGKVIFKNGQAIISRELEKVYVRVITGEVFIQPRGLEQMVQVKPARQNWLSKVTNEGIAKMGVTESVNFETHLGYWRRLYSGKPKEFEAEVKAFANQWRKANEEVAQEQSQLAKRRVASLREEHERRQIQLKKRQEHEAQIRALFRKKSLDQ